MVGSAPHVRQHSSSAHECVLGLHLATKERADDHDHSKGSRQVLEKKFLRAPSLSTSHKIGNDSPSMTQHRHRCNISNSPTADQAIHCRLLIRISTCPQLGSVEGAARASTCTILCRSWVRNIRMRWRITSTNRLFTRVPSLSMPP